MAILAALDIAILIAMLMAIPIAIFTAIATPAPPIKRRFAVSLSAPMVYNRS